MQRDWTVAWQNAWYQIDRRHEGLSLAGKNILVRRLRDGTEQLVYRGQKLAWRKLTYAISGKPGRGDGEMGGKGGAGMGEWGREGRR